jgi:hypothetical protein
MLLHASRTLLGVAVLATCALPMHGQTADAGAIAGTVNDPSRALVARAAIAVKSQATQEERDLASDAEGNFSVQFLPPGKYDLTVRAAGFEPFILNGLQVQITEVSRLNIQLALPSAKQQIVVSAALSLLQTENATLGRVIDQETVVELPLVDRNFTEILGLTAGTNTNIVDATQLGAGSQEIRTNGARSGDNNFMLNGVDANSYSSNITEVTPFGGAGIAIPAPDSIQEFKVQTSLYDAQYGRGAGANVDVETKSGTADFHGNGYYFGRNEALDANNFFANATGVRPAFRSGPEEKAVQPTPAFDCQPLCRPRVARCTDMFCHSEYRYQVLCQRSPHPRLASLVLPAFVHQSILPGQLRLRAQRRSHFDAAELSGSLRRRLAPSARGCPFRSS